jgi:hypothetical protein
MYAEHTAMRERFIAAGLMRRTEREEFVRRVVGRDVEPVGRKALTAGETALVLEALADRACCPWCAALACPDLWEHRRLHAGAEATWRLA